MQHLFALRPLRLALITALALGATLLSASEVWACEAYDRWDNPRPCTFLEEHGECLVSALESHYQCLENKESFLDGVVCHLGTQVDVFACNLSAPFLLFKKAMNPFG